MFKFRVTAALALGLFPLAACASSTSDGMGGADTAMSTSRSIVETAAASPSHGTLVAAVQAAGLRETLSGAGPYTVFAPTNAGFAKLPPGTVDTLLQPANRALLQSLLTYHIVPGRITAQDLIRMIDMGGGQARLTTVQGGVLTAKLTDGRVMLTDAKGGMAHVTQADLIQSNGVIHVTDAVSLPG